jgi:nitrate reductase NapE component
MNSTCASASGPARQRGQSTVEFVVLALVLVPLLLAVPLIGKYMDIAQTAAVASRYAAFEGTVRHSTATDGWKTDADLAMEVRRRFFSNSDAPVKTGDAAGDFNAHRNTLWFDHRGDPLLPKFVDNVGVKMMRESSAQPSGAFYAASLGLPGDNLYTGQVIVNVADIAGFKPFDNLKLSINRSTTVLADSWAASGPGMIEGKIKKDGFNPLGPFPYKPLEVLGGNPVVDLALTLFEYGAPPPDIGRVEPDRVPAGRLK